MRDRRITVFRGDYRAYHRQREERDARAAKDADSHGAAIAREKELVQRYRSHRKYAKMHEHAARADDLVVGYLPPLGSDGVPTRVATAPFLAALRGDRIGIVGPNGAGKTTLLPTIAGELPALDGALSFVNR